MHKVLIFCLALIVLAVGALFAAPRFIDPGWYRDAISTELQRATGRQVVIAGPLALSLLPTPSLVASDVRIANPPGSALPDLLRARHVEAHLAMAPLLGGTLALRSLTLVDPVLDLESLPAAPSIAVERLAVRNGTVLGAGEPIDHLDLAANVANAAGPASAKGSLTLRGKGLDFTLDLDRLGELMPFQLALRLPSASAHLQLAGEIAAPRNGRITVAGKARLGGEDFAALGRLAGQPLLPGFARPFAVNANLAADGSELRLDAMDFTIEEMHGTGSLRIASRDFALALTLNQLDLDRLASGPAGATAAGSAAPPALAALPSELRGRIDVAIEALRWRRDIIRNTRLHAAVDHGAVDVPQLTATLPGPSDLSLNGRLEPAAGEPQFRGAIELESNNLRLLLNWLGATTTMVPADRLRKLSLSSQFTAFPDRVEIGGVDLTIDATRVTGAATVALRQRLGIGARLAVDQFNVDAYLPISPLPAAAQGSPGTTDYPALLAAFDANLDAAVDTLTWRGQPARGVHFAATLQDGSLKLHEAAIVDVAGASATANGEMTGIGGGNPTWRAGIASSGPDVTRLARLLAPASVVAGWLRGPFTLKSDVAGETGRVALDVDLAAHGGRARVSGEIADSATAAPSIDLGIEASHPSFTGLARDLLPGYQPAGGDPGAITLAGRFSEANGIVSARQATLAIGGLTIEGDASLALTGARPKLTADLRFSEIAVDRFLPARQAAGLAPPSGSRHLWPAQVGAGPGPSPRTAAKPWSREPLDLAGLAMVDADLSVTGDTFAWGAWRIERPVAILALSDGLLRLDRLSGGLFGGAVEASGQLAAADGRVKASIGLRHAALEEALKEVAGIGTLAGPADIDLTLATSGLSAAAAVGQLQGSGKLTSRDGTITGIDLAALSARLDELKRTGDPGGLLRGLSGGRTRYRTLDGSFGIADGIVRSDEFRLAADAGEANVDTRLDLPSWLMRLRLELRLTDHAAAPPLAVTLDGPIDAPRILFDVNALESYFAPGSAKPAPRDQPDPLKTDPRKTDPLRNPTP